MAKQGQSLAAFERRKYQKIWAYSQYRHYSPGEHALPLFRQVWRKRGTLVDLGCGTGRAGAKLADDGWDVTLLDFVDNSLDFKVKEKKLPFVRANLWTDWKGDYDYGYCCDCMEHIPEEKLPELLDLIHDYRVGLQPPENKSAKRYAGCWEDMPDDVYQDFTNEITLRRSQAFSRRRDREAGLD